MDKKKLSKANELDCKIDAIKLEIDNIKNNSQNIYINTISNRYIVPQEFKNTLILLVINLYEEKLKELEQEFEEM